jgi:hypothetical protein
VGTSHWEDLDFHLFAKEEDELIVEWVNRLQKNHRNPRHAIPTARKAPDQTPSKVPDGESRQCIGNGAALPEVEVAPAQGKEQGGFDPETFFTATEGLQIAEVSLNPNPAKRLTSRTFPTSRGYSAMKEAECFLLSQPEAMG